MLRDMTDQQIDEVLRTEAVGRIGCCADGKAYVAPISYAYDGNAIYAHSGDGMKIAMMRTNPNVCFEVDHVDNLANWRSVIAWGTYEELFGDEAAAAIQLLLERFLPMVTSETARLPQAAGPAPAGQPREDLRLHRGVVFRITLKEKTGRLEQQ